MEGALWTGRWASELELGVSRVLGYLCRRTGGGAVAPTPVWAHFHGLAFCYEQIDSVKGGVWMVCPSFFLTSQGWSLAFVQTQKLPWESQSWGNGNDLMRRDRK